MTAIEVTIITSRFFLISGSLAAIFFILATLIRAYKKKDYSEYFSLMVFSTVIVIMAKFNLFVPII